MGLFKRRLPHFSAPAPVVGDDVGGISVWASMMYDLAAHKVIQDAQGRFREAES
jgi:hypothetical protein